jgi:hypothetical protein
MKGSDQETEKKQELEVIHEEDENTYRNSQGRI